MDTTTHHSFKTEEAILLLKELIAIPSFSKEENAVADFLEATLKKLGLIPNRLENNVWLKNLHFDANKPTVLLNSHIDTVKPNDNYTREPFLASEVDGKIYGLGSNDAGASVVSLLACFCHYYDQEKLPFNLVFAATAEEEISGKNGIALLIPALGKIDLAIVGEPTNMQMAVAEKGLLVVDAYAKGKSGHAAHYDNVNAIESAMNDIVWLQKNYFEDVSDLLGPVKITVTQISAGTQHNVVPGTCHFVMDIRVNEKYTNEEVFEILKKHLSSNLIARSFRLNSSGIPLDHPIVEAGRNMGKRAYGSPTLSDQALMSYPSLKMGPGDTKRSHIADEFVLRSEIESGIADYIKILKDLKL